MNVDDVIGRITASPQYNRRDVFALTAAYALATVSDMPQRIGAVIMYRGDIVGSGFNSTKSDPMQMAYNRKYRHFNNLLYSLPEHMDGIHAEISAIKSVPYTTARSMDWKKATIYVYRIAPGLPLGIGLARPCEACLPAIRDNGIRNIVYTTDTGLARETIAE